MSPFSESSVSQVVPQQHCEKLFHNERRLCSQNTLVLLVVAHQTEADGNVFYQTIISIKGDPEETLSCKATWLREDDPTETYMIGTLDYRYKRTEEERYRCFLVKETKRGIQVSQSLNSSCYSELHSSTAGHRTLRLVREEEKTNLTCVYPNWASEMETLYSFGFSSKYEFQFGGSILSASNYSSTTNSIWI
ncbi:uncharacterized protein LOC111704454 [Eurytemora carolleeae]|uniref:uncharacterized protein LOC111704454 n=1 Tax=Eurytemora carolleeae TaxID=1294199 RepID=UPI000C78DB97|nr:uncharacterized protein LOC111704454 [Eurytemora carolleeae]|eukprot:XP_023332456.1 uncharacterized protein LOC111704454 [Eurytemora affinis]